MRRFNSSALRNIGATTMLVAAAGFAISAANAASLSLADLNAGPSSNDIPAAASDPVATFVFPREIVDTAIVPDFGDFFSLVDATEVQDSGGLGLRWRSRALIGPGTGVNAASQFNVQAITGFNGDASESYIIFLSLADALTLATPADVDDFVANNTAGVDYVRYLFTNNAWNGGAGYNDVAVVEANLAAGIFADIADLIAATPDGGGAAGDYENYQVAIVVIDDVADGADDVVTEMACVQQQAPVVPADAVFDPDNTVIRIQTNRQLVDDFDADNPADTDVGNLDDTDFRVLLSNGVTIQSLSAFLADLVNPNSVASVTVLTNDDQTHNIIEITLNAAVTDDADIATIIATRIGFTGTDFDSITGENQNNNTATYQLMDRPGDIEVDEVNLLQGNGSFQFGETEVWAQVVLSSGVTNVGGDFQFLLWNEDGNVVGYSDMVQSAVPSSADVPGIDDADQDGTADDPVVEAGENILFARFVVVNQDAAEGGTSDAVNSDATWSDDGFIDPSARAERQSMTLVKNTPDNDPEGFAPDESDFASTDLGDEVADSTDTAVDDLARPQAIQFITQATEAGSELCELVDVMKWVWSETVAFSDAGQFAVAYDDDGTISDLTEGLESNLNIPFIDTLAVPDFEDQVLAVTGGTLTTCYIANDSVAFVAPLIPTDGPAADGATSILMGSGSTAYIGGVNVNGVEGDEDLGNSAIGSFSALEDADFLGGEDIADGAPPALLGATADGSDVRLGFSEDVNNPTGAGESESFFLFTEDDVRLDISGAENDGISSNIWFLEDVFFDADAEILVAVDNPGFPITDNDNNANDFTVTKFKFVGITPPAVSFKDEGVAFVDDETNLVTTVVLKTTGRVEINGSESSFLERLYVRGDDFGSDNGDFDSASGLVSSIEVGDEERNDGCYLFILNMNEDCPLGQEDFFVQYNDSNDQADPADSTLVDFNNGSEVSSEVIQVFVARPSTPSAGGNPIGETYTGTLDLGSDTEDALGSEISAYVFKSISECGDIRFTYKGITYTGTIQATDGDEALIANGTTLYFHPQLRGDDDFCEGEMSPCGLVNSKPDLDLYQVASLNTSGNGGINGAGAATSINNQVLLYQNMDPSFVIKPIALTVRTDTTTPGRFTVTGSGVSNGTITFEGEFEWIGNTYITGDADESGARPYTLHTRGRKNYLGCPVVFVVCPDSNFSDVEPFLANNLLVRRVTFAADNQADVTTGSKSFTFANNAPIVFNINADFVHRYSLSALEQDDWVFLPAAALSPTRSVIATPGQDFGTAGTLPNRVVVPTGTGTATTPVNAITAFPSGTTARGFFVALDVDDCEPFMMEIDTILALDTRGVYCGSARGLNRIAAGYAYAVETDDTFSEAYWFTFGELVSNVSGKSLSVTPNATNGGWNILNNNSNSPITSSTAGAPSGNQIVVSMNDEEGVRIFIEGSPQFSDFEEVGANHGYMLFTDTAIVQ